MDEFQELIDIMARLRHPETGCPWDLKQDAGSLREYVLEEAHEVVEAIDAGAPEKLCEELGDLLLQIVFLARLAEERGEFSARDVARAISRKLIQRHPHIFADARADTAEDVRRNWERIKMREKKKKSIISEYPHAMPALLTAKRIASQVSGVGFDWGNAEQALAKVDEETGELRRELQTGRKNEAEAEIGDLLFAVANVARLLEINPEFALRRANRKFTGRFHYIEDELRRRGRDLHDATLAEMEELWQQAKQRNIGDPETVDTERL
jgi:MazG family protein